jgi:hypothetical protein
MIVERSIQMRRKVVTVMCVSIVMACAVVMIVLTGWWEQMRCIEDDELERLLPETLVQATVVSVGEANRVEVDGTLEIDHVFKGSDDLVGQQCSVHYRRYTYGGGGRLMGTLKQGQIGIWALRRLDGKLSVLWPPSIATEGVAIPARKGISKRYWAVKAAAEVIESIVKADSNKRLKLLKKNTRSSTPEVSVVAVNIMAGLNDENLMGYLQGLLSDSKLTIAGQAAIDRVLSGSEGAEVWQNCSERKALLRRWVALELDEYEARTVRTRVDLTAQHPGSLDYETILNVVKTAMANEAMPMAERRNYLFALRCIYERSELGDQCFDFLVELVRDNKHEEIRLGSAYAIRNFVKLDDNRSAALEQVISGLQDDKLVEILTEAIAKQWGG